MQCNGPATAHQDATTSRGLLELLDCAAVTGLYLHVPFCFHKCYCCDFYSIVDDRDRQAAFTRRMTAEIAELGPLAPAPIRTIFVGGGTPTLLRAELWADLLQALRGAFDLSRLDEFTVEANPETVTDALLAALAGGGVNRLSMGAQSFNPAHLKTLERWHDPASVAAAMRAARRAGITNVNLDLISGIPGQTLDAWLADLDAALALEPAHLSCYSLTYEPNTALTKKLALGQIERIDEGLEAAMFEATIDKLAAAGFEHYEVSNFARKHTHGAAAPGGRHFRCRHNLMYWENGQWLAIGPSASGHVDGVRWKNVPHLGRYLAPGSRGTPIQDVEKLDPDDSIGEQLMLRLRLIEGAPNDWLNGVLSRERRRAIDDLIERGLLERTLAHVRLTRRGLLLADAVISELL